MASGSCTDVQFLSRVPLYPSNRPVWSCYSTVVTYAREVSMSSGYQDILNRHSFSPTFKPLSSWSEDDVLSWMKGLDPAVQPHLAQFQAHCIHGNDIIKMDRVKLEYLQISQIGHQELMLEAIELLMSLDSSLHHQTALRRVRVLSKKASQLVTLTSRVYAHTNDYSQSLEMAAGLMEASRSIITWIDSNPCQFIANYTEFRKDILRTSLEIKNSVSMDPDDCRQQLLKHAKSVVQLTSDLIVPQILQQETSTDVGVIVLDVLLKPEKDGLGVAIERVNSGQLIIASVTQGSPAGRSGRVFAGDEVVQINGQNVVGWVVSNVVKCIRAKPFEALLTLKSNVSRTPPVPRKSAPEQPDTARSTCGSPHVRGRHSVKGNSLNRHSLPVSAFRLPLTSSSPNSTRTATPTSRLPATPPTSRLPATPTSTLPATPTSTLPVTPTSTLPATPTSTLPATPTASVYPRQPYPPNVNYNNVSLTTHSQQTSPSTVSSGVQVASSSSNQPPPVLPSSSAVPPSSSLVDDTTPGAGSQESSLPTRVVNGHRPLAPSKSVPAQTGSVLAHPHHNHRSSLTEKNRTLPPGHEADNELSSDRDTTDGDDNPSQRAHSVSPLDTHPSRSSPSGGSNTVISGLQNRDKLQSSSVGDLPSASYRTKVIGGVVHRIPISASPTSSPSPEPLPSSQPVFKTVVVGGVVMKIPVDKGASKPEPPSGGRETIEKMKKRKSMKKSKSVDVPLHELIVEPDQGENVPSHKGVYSSQQDITIEGRVTKQVEVESQIQTIASNRPSKKQSSPELMIPCFQIRDADYEGWLNKQGGSGLTPKNWRRRWFVLKDSNLFYYKTAFDVSALGIVKLKGYTVQETPDAKKEFAFETKQSGQRTYYFVAESSEEMKKWMALFKAAANEEVVL